MVSYDVANIKWHPTTWLGNSCVALGGVGGGASSHAVLVVDCSGSMRKEARPFLSGLYSWHVNPFIPETA